jgi:Flp pilus assembly protein TadB
MTEIAPVDLLLAGCGTLLVFTFAVAALAFAGWRRATRQQNQQLLMHSQALVQQLSALDERVTQTTTAVRRLDERLERQVQPGAQIQGAPAPGYQIAIRLARSGASREELIASCRLSPGEADLVRRLHGAPNGAGR